MEEQLRQKNEENEQKNQKICQLEAQLRNKSTNPKNSLKINSITILDNEAIKRYKKVKELGRGDTGTAYEVVKEELYVLKELNCLNTESFRNLIKEHEILSLLNHPNVIKTYGVYFSDETTPPAIILEHCIQSIDKSITTISIPQIIFLIYQIAEGIKLAF